MGSLGVALTLIVLKLESRSSCEARNPRKCGEKQRVVLALVRVRLLSAALGCRKIYLIAIIPIKAGRKITAQQLHERHHAATCTAVLISTLTNRSVRVTSHYKSHQRSESDRHRRLAREGQARPLCPAVRSRVIDFHRVKNRFSVPTEDLSLPSTAADRRRRDHTERCSRLLAVSMRWPVDRTRKLS